MLCFESLPSHFPYWHPSNKTWSTSFSEEQNYNNPNYIRMTWSSLSHRIFKKEKTVSTLEHLIKKPSGCFSAFHTDPVFHTWAGGSLDGSGDAVGAVLRDGLNGQLVLAHGGRLHYGNSLQGSGWLGALDDATGAAYRGDGGNRLHFDWEEDTNISSTSVKCSVLQQTN